MRALSYEEIDQQIAYELTNLWSKLVHGVLEFVLLAIYNSLNSCTFIP
jgi:hypothetical protein